MRPRDFCRQSLEVLQLGAPAGDADERGAYETLLRYFASEDPSPETFEMQLHLLADTELCPCFTRAAARTLSLWRSARNPYGVPSPAGRGN